MDQAPPPAAGPGGSGLGRFSALTRAWFEGAFAAPTPAQAGAWETLAREQDVLVVAPTGSGKTLAAFLSAIDRLATAPPVDPRRRLRVLYVSPLKALAADIERNLRAPLAGLRAAAARLDLPLPEITVAMRTGDTPADARRRFTRHPPDILITTPESLFLLLTSGAREAMTSVDTVIVDEVHSVVATKRGAHLALSLERLDELLERPARRIGLSATVRPLDEVARFLGGPRPVTVVAPPSEKAFDLSVVVPVEDMAAIGEPADDPASGSAAGLPDRSSIWPHIDERLVELIRAHRSTIVFANSRRLAERLCANLNELAGTELARAHHGSVSREQRTEIEEDLKAGRLPAVVATSSLELGIDMGAVDLVIQVEAPSSVASGLQRIGRAGHQVGAVSRGIVFPKFRGDLVESAVVVERMPAGAIEAMRYPATPWTCSPSRSWPWWPWTTGPSTTWRPWSAGPPPSPSCPAAPSTASWTCSRAATPPTSSPSCGPASTGTGSRGGWSGGRGPSAWPSPRAAPSPTGACSACSWSGSGPPGSASWTRRWSTSRGSARCSPWAPPAGGSRTSPTTGCWSPRPPASRGSCRSGTATCSGARSSWAAPSAGSCASWRPWTPTPGPSG